MTDEQVIAWGRPEPLWRATLPLLDLAVRLLFRLQVVGADLVPRRGPVLVAANHVSYLDPLVLQVVLHRLGRRARFLTSSGVLEFPVTGWFLRQGRQIPVEPGARVRAIVEARRALRAGELVAVYPEGAIVRQGTRPRARSGAGLLALEPGVVTIPVALWGMQARPASSPALRPRRPAAAVFGAPLDRSDVVLGRGKARQLSQDILDAVRALLPEARRRAGDDQEPGSLPLRYLSD